MDNISRGKGNSEDLSYEGKRMYRGRTRSQTVDELAMVSTTTTIVVQINGKLRARLELPADTPKDEMEQHARVAVMDLLVNTEIKKTIVVPNKLVNIVI